MKAVVVDSKIIDLFKSFDQEKRIFADAGIDFVVGNARNDEEYIDLCKDADALLLIGLRTPRHVIEKLKKCKVIVRYGVGYDCVDIPACSDHGIVVCNVPDAGTNDVASQAFALALNCMRKIGYYDRQIHRGHWHGGDGYTIHRVSTQTFGFCGFGNIARVAARFAAVLGCRLIGYDPFVDKAQFEAAGVEQVSFDELLAQSDVISIHTPLNEHTHHMFSKPVFEKMKRGMIIVNTSRGGVVCQDDLMDAIDAGIVAAAGLDVNECEPLTDVNHRILQYDTIILTPHSGAESVEYFITLQERAARTAIDVLNGNLPKNVLNREQIIKNGA
jgi:D-3-phosphoglycerate dehydrogenase / 2-oxoglutarate reductase